MLTTQKVSTPITLPPTDNIAGLIKAARVAVEHFDRTQVVVEEYEATRLEWAQKAATAMAAAQDAGATQTQIAKGVNRSQAWVSGMLSWGGRESLPETKYLTTHRAGPFAEASKAARDKRNKYQPTNNPELSRPVQVLTPTPGDVVVTKEECEAAFKVARAKHPEKPSSYVGDPKVKPETAEVPALAPTKEEAREARLLREKGGDLLTPVSAELIETSPTHRFGASSVPIIRYGKEKTIERLQNIGRRIEKEIASVREHLAIAQKLCDDEAAFDEFKRVYCPSLCEILAD